MKKSELRKLIREIVHRKLNEAGMSVSVSGDQQDSVQAKIETKPDDKSTTMNPADQAKMDNYKSQQDKINNSVRKIDGTIKKLEAPVLKKKQDLERKKAKLQQDVGKTSTEIEKLQKKYNK